MPRPSISVLMAVRDGERHLQETIDSILRQTYREFEFVIVDDGSRDRTAEILERQRDSRIRVHRVPVSLGVAGATNVGLALCQGKYIARTDADDLSAPERFDRQVRLLEARPDIGLCGSRVQMFGDGRPRVPRVPTASDDIAAELVFGNCIAHSTVMMRREVLVSHGLTYDATLRRSLDYDLWTRLALVTSMVVLPEPLVRYRVHEQSLSATDPATQRENRVAIAVRYLIRLASSLPDGLLELHRAYLQRDFARLADPERFDAWVSGLLSLSGRAPRLDGAALQRASSARVAEVFRWPSWHRIRAARPLLEHAAQSRRLDLLGYAVAGACVPGPVWGYLRFG